MAASRQGFAWPGLQQLKELRGNGVKIERIPSDVAMEIKRICEIFLREWVGSVGNETSTILYPTMFSNLPSRFKK